ncbi:cation diffusion zinc membrane transporter Zrg17 [Friedmanniomyces endolithicus]|nr:cation diffusion zinc membrane transporter Zrg17 [Friedmanniomyces endolithicus]
MASTLPIPAPPSTPTPPNEEGYALGSMPDGLGIRQNYTPPPAIRTVHDYDRQKGITESPSAAPDNGGNTDSAATMLSPTSATFSMNGLSPQSTYYSPATPQTAGIDGGFQTMDAGASTDSPFNFTTVQYTSGKGSISANGADATHRASLSTDADAERSLVEHDFPPDGSLGYVQFSGAGSLAMTALSRLLLFDAAGATVCVAVDVMENFEVWKRSSIKHPFGLERADVLAGFGMAVFITFMGLDIISHGIQHSLENIGHHESHSPHSHERVAAGPVDISALLSITSTLVSAVLLRNHARIGRAMRLNLIAGWGKILGNPSHFLTLSASCLLLIMPFLDIRGYKYFDLSFSFAIALLMIAFGVRLGMSLASMLLMSYKPHARDKRAVREVIDEIETDPGVSSVEEARFWQVHYGLCMANLKLRYRNGGGYGDEMMRIRQRVTSLIRQRLGDVKGVVWEISVQMAVERD